jgi:GDP-L-fucose synthase
LHPSSRIYVAGGETLLGAALLERLRAEGLTNLVGTPPEEPDATDADCVDAFFGFTQPEYVFLAAGSSGGIHANQQHPADLMRDNLLTVTHLLHSAFRHRAKKLLYLASACSYPRDAAQPMRVEDLTTGPLEPTSAAYATAKLAGLTLCQAYCRQYGVRFITAIPANPFGPGDDFSRDGSHVIPGLIRRMHEAKRRGDAAVTVWGTGAARREFAYARDLADACLFVMRRYEGLEPINLGGGTDRSIAEVARDIAQVVGFPGRLGFDASRPDGALLKCLDSRPLRELGWSVHGVFTEQLRETYAWFLANVAAPSPDPLPWPAGERVG